MLTGYGTPLHVELSFYCPLHSGSGRCVYQRGVSGDCIDSIGDSTKQPHK